MAEVNEVPQQIQSKLLYQEPPNVPRTKEEIDKVEMLELLARHAAEDGMRGAMQGPDVSSWAALPKHEGALAVVGSGIKAVCDFTSEAVSFIQHADKVYYCVADPITEVFIKTLHPDAQDLYVFYSNDKERYHTYVQMAEVLLYDVRKGLKVTAVYYGHPGVFVLPSHRAVQIARKQGLRAFLVPAVSALDCLVADVDFDPSYPGLQILEATDMLLRRRTILTDRHVVIWQVGCVGNPGYRRQGYLKEKFTVLLDYLEEFYNPSYEIVHYIGSQFPTISPVIERIPLGEFRSPEVVKKVNGISTFYIPPKGDALKVDQEMAQKLELTNYVPSSTKQPTNTPSTEYAMYTKREHDAIKDLADFQVPQAHAFTPLTAASNYLEELSVNPTKLEMHLKQPLKELQTQNEIPARDVQNLARGNRLLVRAAVKPNPICSADRAALRILTDPAFAHQYEQKAMSLRKDVEAAKKLSQWLQLRGYNTNPDAIHKALVNLQQSTLLPWTNVYNSSIGRLEIAGAVPPNTGTVTWTGIPINNFTVENSVLKWSAGIHNDSSGEIAFSLQGNQPVVDGKFWPKSETKPTQNNFHGTTRNFRSPINFWEGRYKTVLKISKGTRSGKELEISFPPGEANGKLTLGGIEISPFSFEKTTLTWSNGKITFYVKSATVSEPKIAKFYGKLWESRQSEPATTNFWGTLDELNLKEWGGVYKTYVDKSGAAELIVQPSTDLLPACISYGSEIPAWQFDNPVLSWSSSGETNAELQFKVYSDGRRGFAGKLWLHGSTKPVKNNTKGVIDKFYLSSWSSTYYTKLLDENNSNKTNPGDLLQIIGKNNMKSSSVILQGVELRNWTYCGAKKLLSWTEKDNSTNATITLNVGTAKSVMGPGIQFYGKYWKKGGTEPSKTNWWGSLRAPDQTGRDGLSSGSSRRGSSGPLSARNVGIGIGMGMIGFAVGQAVIKSSEYLWKYMKAAEKSLKKFWKEKFNNEENEANRLDEEEMGLRESQMAGDEQPVKNELLEPDDNNPDDPPPNDAPDDSPPPDDAPLNDAPPDDAPPDDIPPNAAPTDDAPPDDVDLELTWQ